MRSQTSSSSSSKPLNLTTVIDFNRNRSNESTEAVDNSKMMNNNNQFPSSASSCSGMSAHSAEGRCVPISPKKMPATPPRDAGSPASFGYGATPPSSQSSFFSNSAVPIFPSMKMMASSWRTKDEAQASVFRSPPTMISSRSSSGGSGINAFFSIQRCNAFDEDDMIDDEEDEVFCYSDDEEDDDDNNMTGMFKC